jgi:hypothetical protein
VYNRGVSSTFETFKAEYGKMSGASDLMICNPFTEMKTAQRVRVKGQDYEVLLVCPFPIHYEVVLKKV